MKEIDWPAPCGYTVFCDDIRQEEGGKSSYMGVYRGILFTNTDFPATFPKFGFGVVYTELASEPIPPLTLMIYLPGDADDAPTFSIDIPDIASTNLKPNRHASDNPRYLMNMPIVAGPLTFNKAGKIKVRMKRGDEVVRLGSLTVDRDEESARRPDGNESDKAAPSSK